MRRSRLTIVVLTLAIGGLAGQRASIQLVDISSSAGVNARLESGDPEKKWIPEANGTGCAALDFDNDGNLDLLITAGTSMSRMRQILDGKPATDSIGGVYLYRNDGRGHFIDVTARSGLRNPYWGTGANAADFDNDGDTDVLITTIGRDLLYRNNGDGTFTEIGESAGLSREIHWHTGSAFGDYDQDGDLDIFISGYVDVHTLKLSGEAPVCDYRGMGVFCGPLGLKGETDIFYRNNGDGTFTDVSTTAGVADAERRYGFTAVFNDFNADGRIDLFVANDSSANYLYLNRGESRFEESGLSSGVAFNSNGKTQANMGVAVADYDNDGRQDILTTTFSEDHFPLFHQTGNGVFEEVADRAGLAIPTIPLLGWACGFDDLNNDGVRDLWTVNGHVYPQADRIGSTTYLQPITIFEYVGGRFRAAPGAVQMGTKQSWRGGCAGDFNNDGRIDLAVMPVDGSPLILENRTQSEHHWIGFTLEGRGRGSQSNHDAIGASLRLDACGKTWVDTVMSGGSYISRNDPRKHFGLGSCAAADRLSVTWPDGTKQFVEKPSIDRYTTISQSVSERQNDR